MSLVDTVTMMVRRYGMATMTHRATFALDEGTIKRLKKLALRWQVSQAEVVRRTLSMAEKVLVHPPDIQERLAAAGRLQESLQGRHVNIEAWIRQVRAARR